MKKKNLVLISSLMLVALLIAGGTMAWFTAETRVEANKFKAGTLKIDLIDNFNECNAQNVNPGDCYKKQVKVKNLGTKRAFVRIKKQMEFEGGLSTHVVDYTLGQNWEEYDGYFYYTKMLNAPTKDRWGRTTYDYTTELFAKNKKGNNICFNGPEMDNKYQGKKFTINVKAEAVQVTNGAPQALWSVNPTNPKSHSALVIEREIIEEEAALEEAVELEEIVEE